MGDRERERKGGEGGGEMKENPFSVVRYMNNKNTGERERKE